MSQENVELVRTVLASLTAGIEVAIEDDDFLRSLEPLLHPDFEFVLAGPEFTGLGGSYPGLEGFQSAMREWLEAFESYRSEPERIIDAGDEVLALTRDSGRTKTAGVEIEIEGASVWTFRDGKIRRVSTYQDRSLAFEAVGLRE
jgi:ketosteroid isomerase-like protein